jgi:hypothetical protein
MERAPQIGDRSPDGSRVYDGKYWVLQRTAPVIEEYVPPAEQYLPLHEFAHESGGFGFGGLIVAIAVGLVLAYAPYPAIPTDSFDTALQELAISFFIRSWGTFIAVFLILSIGRRAIDVQLLRSMIVAFVLGFVFFLAFTYLFLGLSLLGLRDTSRVPPIALPFIGGAIWAVTLGPVIAIAATLANLLWYRSFRSLKPWLLIRREIRG